MSGGAPILVGGMSRSGTTLLATVLDAHPRVSMGYELMPVELPDVDRMIATLTEAHAASQGRARRAAKTLREWGLDSFAVFVMRCVRTRIDPLQLVDVLRRLAGEGWSTFDGLEGRLAISRAVVEAKRVLENTEHAGFKLTTADLERVDKTLRHARYACIVRDPRDVVASHQGREIDRPTRDVVRSWKNYTRQFTEFVQKHPDRSVLVRYESLVADPVPVLQAVLPRLGVPFDEAVLRFFDSKASVHREGQSHANAEDLRRDFHTEGVDRWRRDLDPAEATRIERGCQRLMARVDEVSACLL